MQPCKTGDQLYSDASPMVSVLWMSKHIFGPKSFGLAFRVPTTLHHTLRNLVMTSLDFNDFLKYW